MSPGLHGFAAARPILTGLARATSVVSLEGRWLLHAGPPYAGRDEVPPPVIASAALAAIHEGWADTATEAEALVRSGAIRLEPAQAHRCVTPLAALIAPSTPLLVVEEPAGVVAPVFAPLGTTRGPDLRFGTRDEAILRRLARRDTDEAEAVASALEGAPIDLLEVARAGLEGGDDLHNRTTAATAALVSELRARARGGGGAFGAERVFEAIEATPLYFLTFWMAAARLILSAAETDAPPSLVTRMAGNGNVFGLSLAGRPAEWTVVPADPPRGPYISQAGADARPTGAIGDSAVIDALGFGAQALRFAAEPRESLKGFLPPDWEVPSLRLMSTVHPAFASLGVRVGLDARRVVDSGCTPLVTLGMVERTGEGGLLGRGIYRPPLDLFRWALDGLT